MTRRFFAVECRLTCLGGSEKGTCICKNPNDCYGVLKPGWVAARDEAKARMGRHLVNSLELNGEKNADR